MTPSVHPDARVGPGNRLCRDLPGNTVTGIPSCCRAADAGLTESLCPNNGARACVGAVWPSSVNQALPVFPAFAFPDSVMEQTPAEVEEDKYVQASADADVRWMALRRGMRVGLLGGEELVLWRLRLLSMEGDA